MKCPNCLGYKLEPEGNNIYKCNTCHKKWTRLPGMSFIMVDGIHYSGIGVRPPK